MKTKRILIYSLLAISVVISGVFAVVASNTTDSNEYVIWVENITEYRGKTKTAPTLDKIDSANFTVEQAKDWVFAGWFTGEACTAEQALATDKNDEGAFAKFVPAEVLGMKTQVGKNLIDNSDLTDDDSSSIRFITSVDSLNYSEVGFEIQIGDGTPVIKSSNIVYKTIYGQEELNGEFEVKEYTPENTFHAKSKSFKTFKYTNVPSAAYNTDIKVTPLWITMDGTTVKSSESVVCVNKCRQWKVMFVNDPVEGQTGTGAGTYGNPYTTLDAAITHMNTWGEKAEDKTGATVVVKNEWSNIKTTTETGWAGVEGRYQMEKHENIPLTIQGYQTGKEVLDLSANNCNLLGGDVVFKNLNLKLDNGSAKAAFLACGYELQVDSDVTANNALTTIYGGSMNARTVNSTSMTLKAGTYRTIYGGGYNADVEEDTNLVLENTQVHHASTSMDSKVFAGGRNGDVGGDTHVTIGNGFNNGKTVDYQDHQKLSTVWGGGDGSDGSATVEGSTYVNIEGDAIVDFVYGAGYTNSSVKGTSHVEIENGEMYGVFGGGAGVDSTNANTSVVVTGGTIAQVFGGVEMPSETDAGTTGMSGHANVQILGGTITRRIYGGCYNELGLTGWSTDAAVKGSGTEAGTVNVTIGSSEYIDLTGDTDCCLCAVSRRNTNSETETGIMVIPANDTALETDLKLGVGSGLYTNYLVRYNAGGTVVAQNGALRIEAEAATPYATITYGDSYVHIKNEGTYTLPELADKDYLQEVTVTFSDSIDLSIYEAKNVVGNGERYYTTFSSAYEEAADGTRIVLLKDVSISSEMDIEKNITIANDGETDIKITSTATSASNMFDVRKMSSKITFSIQGNEKGRIILAANVGISDNTNKKSVRAIAVRGDSELDLDYVNIEGFYRSEDKNQPGAAIYLTAAGANVYIDNCEFNGNASNTTGGGAIHIVSGATVTCKTSIFTDNISSANAVAIQVAGSAELSDVSIVTGEGTTTTQVIKNVGAVTSSDFTKVTNGIWTGSTGTFVETNGDAWFLPASAASIVEAKASVDTTYYATVEAAINAVVTNGGTVDVLQDDTLNYTVSKAIKGNVIIQNKMGKDVTLTRGSNAKNIYLFTISANKQLTLGRAKDDNDGNIGTLTIDGGGTSASGSGRIISNSGAFVLNENVTIQNVKSSNWGVVLVNASGGTANLYGNMKDNECTGAGGIILQNGGALTIHEGLYSGNKGTRAVTHTSKASLGAVIGVNTTANLAGNITINGGTFENNDATGGGSVLYVRSNYKGTVNITGATFTGNKQNDVYVANGGSTPTVDSALSATIANTSGTAYTVNAGTAYYATLDAAIADTAANDTIKLSGDIALAKTTIIDKKITIENQDGVTATVTCTGGLTLNNGADVTFGSDTADGEIIFDRTGKTGRFITLTEYTGSEDIGAKLTLADNATIKGASSGSWGSVMIINQGTTVNLNGTIRDCVGTGTGSNGAVLLLDGTLNITGGSYTNNTGAGTKGAFLYVVGGSLNVTGGTFSNNKVGKDNGNGGAIYVEKANQSDSNIPLRVTIDGGATNTVSFTENAKDDIYIAAGNTATVRNTTIGTGITVGGTLTYSNITEDKITVLDGGSATPE